jgi:hypothetical protein
MSIAYGMLSGFSADPNYELLKLDKDDITAILNVYSFIDKNDVLMQKKYEEINALLFNEYLEDYIGLVKKAKLRCLKRVA